MKVNLAFRLQASEPLPADHGYALYAASCRLIPAVHGWPELAIHPISGRQTGPRQLSLMPWSSLIFQVDAEQISLLLPLTGKTLQLQDAKVRVGVPEVRPLAPTTALRSRLVVIRVAHTDGNALTAEAFATAARKQLAGLGISSKANLHVGKRRTLRLKQKEIVGYEAIVEGLTAEESITLQERGIGGKRLMGCGVFVAVDRRAGS